MNVNKKPTLNASMNWDREMSKKKRLKKYLNWLKSTTGTKLKMEYLELEIRLEIYFYYWALSYLPWILTLLIPGMSSKSFYWIFESLKDCSSSNFCIFELFIRMEDQN